MISALLFGIFAFLLILGVPIAISLGVASSVVILVSGTVSSSYIPQGLVTSLDSFPLMAVPFFILAGELMSRGGLSSRLLNVGKVLFGRYKAGLAIIAVATCMFFGAISGSGPATVARQKCLQCLTRKVAAGGFVPNAPFHFLAIFEHTEQIL